MIAFFCSEKLPCYTTNPDRYAYLHGKTSSTGYYYHILKNEGLKDIILINDIRQASKCEALVFHYDDYSSIKDFKGKLIQVVTDRPYIEDLDAYICCNEFMLKPQITPELAKIYPYQELKFDFITPKWFHVHYPPTFGVKKCNPSWPPKNFKFVGRKHIQIKDILLEPNILKLESSLNIKLTFDFDRDVNDGTEDVYFCIRNVARISLITNLPNAAGRNGNKTPNRLYQSWYMNTPSIFNLSPEMFPLIKDSHDSQVANNFDEFYNACEKLVKDETFFWKSVERCRDRCNELNPYHNINLIRKQWEEVFKFLNI
jgi:hypothetical protein